MEEPKTRRSRLQSTLGTVVIVVLLLGPIVFGPMLPVPDFVREWRPSRRPDFLHYVPEGLLKPEELQEVQNTWERFWFLGESDELSPERVHGGVI